MSIKYGYAALHYAVVNAKPCVVELLLQKGVAINIKNKVREGRGY